MTNEIPKICLWNTVCILPILHPSTDSSMVSIHPCRHAETMKRMIDRLKEAHDYKAAEEAAGEGQFGVSPDVSLFLFLKVCFLTQKMGPFFSDCSLL